jgi:hypothetical protein
MTDDLSDLTPMQRRALETLRASDPRNVPHALEVMRNQNRKRRPPRTMRDMKRDQRGRCDHEFVGSNTCAKCGVHVSALKDETEEWYP